MVIATQLYEVQKSKNTEIYTLKGWTWEFPGGPVVRNLSFTADVHSLDGEVRSHKPHSVARKKRKRVNFMYVNYIPIRLL